MGNRNTYMVKWSSKVIDMKFQNWVCSTKDMLKGYIRNIKEHNLRLGRYKNIKK